MFFVNSILSALIWLISILPFWAIYLLADILYFFGYYVFGYRKKVVFANMHNAFPKKSHKEIKAIAKKFYYNLCDFVFENVKLRSMSKEQLLNRMRFKNIEILDDLYNRKKSVIAVLGHCGNWEWMSCTPLVIKHKALAVAKPLSSEYFDNAMSRLRTRFGLEVSYMKVFYRTLLKYQHQPTLSIFAADQTPTKNEIEYWTPFLNQEAAVFLGTEKIAKAMDFAVVFFNIQRIRRGFYEVEIIKVTDTPKETKEFEITEKHVRLLEKAITEHPDNWLWSHNRWKHKKT